MTPQPGCVSENRQWQPEKEWSRGREMGRHSAPGYRARGQSQGQEHRTEMQGVGSRDGGLGTKKRRQLRQAPKLFAGLPRSPIAHEFYFPTRETPILTLEENCPSSKWDSGFSEHWMTLALKEQLATIF